MEEKKNKGRVDINIIIAIVVIVCVLAVLAFFSLSGKLGENVKWKQSLNGTVTIYGEGKMEDYLANKSIFDDKHAIVFKRLVKEVVVEDGVTSISKYAFAYCKNLTSIDIPNSVTSIDWGAFYGCESLETIKIPDNITFPYTDMFFECRKLANIEVSVKNPEHSSSVNGVLYNKDKTELIIYPAGKTDTEFVIPNSVTCICVGAFKHCKNLISIMIPESVTSIGVSALSGCTSLTSVTIPNNVTSIGSSAFAYCKNLTSITIPASVTSIDSFAFSGCENLTIHGEQGSYAEQYAKEHKIKFVPVN